MGAFSPRFVAGLRSLVIGVAVAGAAGMLLSEPAVVSAATYQYGADTTAPARRQGMVSSAGFEWTCVGSRCTTKATWPTPTVEACRALAQQVGPVRSYGRTGRMLTASELQQCNAAATTGQPSGLPATVSVRPPSSAGPAPGPVVITADTLRYTGLGPVVITADTLRYTGLGPVVITAGTLRYTGLGPVVVTADTLRYAGLGPVVIRADTLRYTGAAR